MGGHLRNIAGNGLGSWITRSTFALALVFGLAFGTELVADARADGADAYTRAGQAQLFTLADDADTADQAQHAGDEQTHAADASTDAPSDDDAVAAGDEYGSDVDAGYGYSMELADPFEPINRLVFGVNDAVDIVVLRPVAIAFRAVVPPPVRMGLANFLANAYSPVTFANDILQGEAKRAETTAVRFFLNTVAGFGGIRDVAAEAGWVGHREDFGQTLAVWGFPSGPYIVAPILGPSTPRHLVGRAVDVLANPWTWILWDYDLIESASPTLATLVSDREEAIEIIDGVRSSSPDYYVTIRNLYWQNRTSEIANGEIVEDALPDIPDVR